MIAVPTTLSAAEFTWWGGALDTVRQVKEPFGYPLMMPKTVILDPKITLATPLALFLSSGMKAVDHSAERLASLNSEPFKDAAVMQSLRLLSRGLPRVQEQSGDLQARLDCQMGMAIGMMGPATGAGVGASHAIGHALGADNLVQLRGVEVDRWRRRGRGLRGKRRFADSQRVTDGLGHFHRIAVSTDMHVERQRLD